MKINEKVINVRPVFKNYKKGQEAKIQGLLHPAEANLGFQSLQLPSTQPESPLAPKSLVCFLKYILNCEQKFSSFIFRSGLSGTEINCYRISEGLLRFNC
jgi:hypothetical protein